ncbi:hypothetical protein A2963_00240 [Candidatus Roizmanbacteria bacterium RIFCSPLOWO2_01_FULL_40_13]|nr:MAG: hypothetical protein A2963_00240 [Candidatus Roizmanbacteria bacterium RIFCSPLOWO2_01_FULL_40_13]
MNSHNRNIGKRGENEAAIYLQKKGYEILVQNYHSHWGEIDIIGKKNNTISFVEVKTRMGEHKGKPYEAVGLRKIVNLKRAIKFYLLQNNFKSYKLSLDVISITFSDDFKISKFYHFKQVDGL